MPPRDIASLVDYLIRNRAFAMQMSNLLAQWGPATRRLLGAELLPPRLVQLNEDTIERVY